MKRLVILLLISQFFIGFSQDIIEPVLPEIITAFPNVRDIAISPNGDEIMFSAQSVMGNLSVIMVTNKKNDIWSAPDVAPFSGKFFDLEPFFALDGLKLYFVSTRALNSNDLKPKDFDIWYVERSDLNSAWSEPINMGSPINTEHGEFYPSIASNGNFYFTRDNPTLKSKDDIYKSPYKNNTYQEPVALSAAINSTGYEYNAFISPDESYLIFGCYNRKEGYGSGDLYISFNSNNEWSPAKNMSSVVNSDKWDYCPFVDLKNDILYFTSKRDHINTEQYEPLKLNDLKKELYKYSNGSSRLYKLPISELLNTLKSE